MIAASVVVSTYNQERFIEECLKSVLDQVTDFQFEIIVANDCSTDSTAKVINAIALGYPDRLTVLNREKNLGAAQNYIDAHDRAAGDIVFHIDGDDVMLPLKLQKQFDAFQQHESVNVVFHRARYFSDDGLYQSETGQLLVKQATYSARQLARWGTIAVHSSYAYRRTSRRTRNLQREFMEWFFAMDSVLPNNQFVYLDEVLCLYRINNGGSSYTSSRAGRKKSYLLYFRDLTLLYEAFPLMRDDLYANAVISFLGMLKNGKFLSGTAASFLIKNCLRFSPARVVETWRVRSSVAPIKRLK